jgi:hypothetical protein
MTMNKSYDLSMFLTVVESQTSFDLPDVAEQVGIEWHVIRRELERNEDFRNSLAQVYERIKYKMIDRFAKQASGMEPLAKLPPVGAIKFVIEVIDSGALLGGTPTTPSATSESALDGEALADALGIGEGGE